MSSLDFGVKSYEYIIGEFYVFYGSDVYRL